MKPINEEKLLAIAMGMIGVRRAASERGVPALSIKMMKNMNIYLALSMGDTAPVVEALRSGEVNELDERVIGLLADHLEGKIKKTRGPSRKVSKKDRDLNIYLAFKKLDEIHGYDAAVDMLEKQTALGRKSIEKIITEFNENFAYIEKAAEILKQIDLNNS